MKGSVGSVRLNEEIRTSHPRFKKLIAYIPQEEQVRPGLTIHEAMTVAAHLKLGYSVSKKFKVTRVRNIFYYL